LADDDCRPSVACLTAMAAPVCSLDT
jgi:hypothetical protein